MPVSVLKGKQNDHSYVLMKRQNPTKDNRGSLSKACICFLEILLNIVYSMLLDFWSLEGAGDQISEIHTVSADSKKCPPESNCQSPVV